MIVSFLVLSISVAVLTLGAELFVRGASTLALRAGVSPLFVGLTVVGFGTSSPELGASMSATLSGNAGISIGNVIGSNIFNIALILGLTALIRPIRIAFSAVRRDVFVALAVCIFPLIGYWTVGAVTRPLGLVCLGVLVIYLAAAYFKDRAALAEVQERAEAEVTSTLLTGDAQLMTTRSFLIQLGLGILGLALLVLGARYFVGSATDLARSIGVSELVIGLTIVAVGTSLPELVTSIVAAWRGNADVAVGNVIGSNIFNVLAILGGCAIVAPQPIDTEAAYIGIPLMIFFSAALIPFIRSGGVLSRREGAVLLTGYVLYMAVITFRAMGGTA